MKRKRSARFQGTSAIILISPSFSHCAASFEIAFGRPRDRLPGIDEEVFAEMGRLLERGLKAVRANNDGFQPIEGLDTDQTIQLFEVIRALTPPTRGDVERVEIGGEMVGELSGSRVLTRDDRVRSVQRIKASRKAPRKESPFRVSGVIEEADQGNFCFTLRQLDPPDVPVVGHVTEILFGFEERLYDTVMEAFNSLERMVVRGGAGRLPISSAGHQAGRRHGGRGIRVSRLRIDVTQRGTVRPSLWCLGALSRSQRCNSLGIAPHAAHFFRIPSCTV